MLVLILKKSLYIIRFKLKIKQRISYKENFLQRFNKWNWNIYFVKTLEMKALWWDKRFITLNYKKQPLLPTEAFIIRTSAADVLEDAESVKFCGWQFGLSSIFIDTSVDWDFNPWYLGEQQSSRSSWSHEIQKIGSDQSPAKSTFTCTLLIKFRTLVFNNIC